MLDAADEAVYRLGRHLSISSSTLKSYLPHDSRDVLPRNWHTYTDVHDRFEVSDPDKSEDSTFRWVDDDDNQSDLGLDDYHTAVAETARLDKSLICRPRSSFRRELSPGSLHLGRSSVSSSKTPLSSWSVSTPRPTCEAQSRPPTPSLAKRHRSQNSIATIDPSAKHYQDPEARLKLRVYLASPQKFDEAIEFGFPSTEVRGTTVQAQSPRSPQNTEESGLTFYNDDSGSLFQEDMDDTASSVDSDSPRTPLDTSFLFSHLHEKSGLDRSAVLKPHTAHKSSEPYAQASTAKREMTLHMTLTRPDLRSAECPKAVHTGEEDPLRLPDLSLCEGIHPIWEDCPLEKSRMKKLWRRLWHR